MFFQKTETETKHSEKKPDMERLFESSEKKLEIIFSDQSPSLRKLPEHFWQKVIKACKANIISSKTYPSVTAYLLSESSLLIWDHRMIMITCGKTVLPKTLLKIQKTFSKNQIKFLFFQRKNEFFPEHQKSGFSKDLQLIKKKIKGTALRFGPIHQHHCSLFYMNTECRPDPEDRTLEILMYDSQTIRNTSKNSMTSMKTKLQRIFPGFEIQDHYFTPPGYSLNAVRGEEYYTIHITPQPPAFYISFEAGFQKRHFREITDKLLRIFQPQSFDLIFFHTVEQNREEYDNSDFFKASWHHCVLTCGYEVSYMNFQKTRKNPLPPQSVNY